MVNNIKKKKKLPFQLFLKIQKKYVQSLQKELEPARELILTTCFKDFLLKTLVVKKTHA